MSEIQKLYEAIGSLANELAKTGKKMTFSELNERLGNLRNSPRAMTRDVSFAYDYFKKKGDYQTALNISQVITNQNGDLAHL